MTKKIINLLLVVSLLVSFGIMGTTVASAAEPTTFFYVAPNGNDSAAGTMDAPFATMVGARDAIRNLKKTSGLPDGGVVVYIRGGFYEVTEEIHFSEEDSGTENAPIVYKAYPGEKPIISGGVNISGRDFKPVKDKEILERISNANAKKKVVAVNLKDYGYTEYPAWTKADAGRNSSSGVMVFIDNIALDMARYPNRAEDGDNEWNKSGNVIVRQSDEAGKGPKWQYTDARVDTWKSTDNVVIFADIPSWSSHMSVVDSIDKVNKTIQLKYPSSHSANTPTRYFYANVLEELDVEGEYYLDYATGMLYIYPPKDVKMANATVGATRLGTSYEDAVIEVWGADWLTFSGLRVELSCAMGIAVIASENVLINNCEVVNHGATGVAIGSRTHGERSMAARGMHLVYSADKYWDWNVRVTEKDVYEERTVRNCGVMNSLIANCGSTCVAVSGGDRMDLEPGNNFVTNNIIHTGGFIHRQEGHLLDISGMGNYAGYNTMYNCEGMAVNYNGNEIIIEHNDVSDALKSSADMGVFYSAGWDVEMNLRTEIRYNYIHDIEDEIEGDTGASGVEGLAQRHMIYNDNCQPFLEVHHNIFENGVFGQFNGSGYENNFRHNLFIDVSRPIYNMANNQVQQQVREKGTPIGNIAFGEYEGLKKHFPEEFKKWVERYPEIEEVAQKLQERLDTVGHPDSDYIGNVAVFNKKKALCAESYTASNADTRYCTIENNKFTVMDPGFVDINKGDFRWKEDAPIFETHPEMKNVDITKMGVNKGTLYNKFANSVALKVGNPNAVAFGNAKLIDSNNPVVAPLIVDSRTLVPVRFISESFGGEVGWDAETRTVTIKIDGKTVTMVLDKNELMIDGAVAATMDVPAQSIEGRTMVPLRALCETVLNKSVFWDNRGLIVISDDAGFLDAEKDKTVIDDMVKFVTVY